MAVSPFKMLLVSHKISAHGSLLEEESKISQCVRVPFK